MLGRCAWRRSAVNSTNLRKPSGTQGYAWDLPNINRGRQDDGVRQFGADYYQDMMFWSFPTAIAGSNLGNLTKPGGLVARILKAARAKD